MEIDFSLDKDKSKGAVLKVFEGDDPHDLAVKFSKEHFSGQDRVIQYYENDIREELQALAQDGVCDDSTTTLYRGLGLPKTALKAYRELLQSKKRFFFTGFTSTTLNEEIALGFAF